MTATGYIPGQYDNLPIVDIDIIVFKKYSSSTINYFSVRESSENIVQSTGISIEHGSKGCLLGI